MMFEVFFVVFGFLHLSYGQNSLVNEYVTNITKLQEQALTWTYPVNSYSYVGDNFNADETTFDGEYDFIICGAGSAGSVIANRLSEVKRWKILLIEAGTWENDMSDIPDMADYMRTTNYNWGYHVAHQNNSLRGYIDNSITIPRGKAIGGSSVINAMIYARGNKADFDKWSNQSNPGWSYDDVLPFFKKSEKVAFPNASQIYHGTTGTLNVEYSRIVDEVGESFLDAQKELGRKILDYNAESQMGFSIVQLTEINGRRDSGGKAFINPAKNRSNLHISTESLITKLLIHQQNKTVYGVQYVRNQKSYYATAKREVILSAGAINSPQILMLSGIGPKQHLKDNGITVLQDLPVGENLWDHVIYNYQSFGMNHTYVNNDVKTNVEEYLAGKGVYTTADNLQCIGYVSLLDGTDEVPDVEHVFHANKPGSQPYQLYKNFQRFTEESYETIIKPTVGINQWAIHSLLLHPKSRGKVTLKSNSPFDYPIIDPNYFSDPRDAETLSRSIQDMIKIADTPAMQKYNTTIIKVCHPSCNCSDWGSDDFWKCMATNLANSVFHFSGTCKMGPKKDNTAVVDHTLRVHGIKRLRVADCSVIPVTLSGHTNAPAFMIGEKLSNLIKITHCRRKSCK